MRILVLADGTYANADHARQEVVSVQILEDRY
jgi:hypothetical protein